MGTSMNIKDTARVAADLPWGTRIVAGAFLTSGVVHIVRPQVFATLIPPWLGEPRPWVLGSGVAELTCAVGLLTRQRWAPAATALTLTVIWIGNVQMAVAIQRSHRSSTTAKAAAWVRVPLQVPLIRWAWRSPPRGC